MPIKIFNKFKEFLFSKKFLAVILLFAVSVSSLVLFISFNKKEIKSTDLEKSNLPYKEKVGEGVWALKNYDPIKQTFAKEKVNTNLVENKNAIKSSITNPSDIEIYRWSVTLPNKTVFAFGQQLKNGVFPAVKVTNKDGIFVKYYPEGFEGVVRPVVKGNVVEWEIANGIKARYTMKEDRVKADYIVASKENLLNYQFSFNLNHSDKLETEITPNGDIAFIHKDSLSDVFVIPAPRIVDSLNKEVLGKYNLLKSQLLIDFNSSNLSFPIIVDPQVIDSTATATGTAYANARKILRDGWGNLIALIDGGTGNDNVWYKNYNSGTWTDANLDLDAGGGSSVEIAADLDSTGSAHLAFRNTTASAIQYKPLKINRDGSNLITSITTQASFSIDTSTFGARPSLIVANKGGGAGVEKIALVYGMNSTGAGRGEIRFIQCDIADNCGTAASWKNASEDINGSSTCNDTATSGNVGLPNSATCKGATDKLFGVATNTTHHAVVSQMPGKEMRTPLSAKKFDGLAFTNLSNALDNNTGTTVGLDLDITDDFLYIGDSQVFSNIVANLTGTNGITESIIGDLQYCSAVDGSNNCTIWSSVSNFVDGTANSQTSFVGDGFIFFDEPSNWISSTVNSVNGYWVRLRMINFDSAGISVAEFGVTDRNSKALIVVGGVDSTDDLGVAYIPWNFIDNNKWERNIQIPGNGWRTNITSLDTLGGNWTTFTNYPLTSTVDYINNGVYVAYVEDIATDVLHIKTASNDKDLSVAANWTDTSFPTVTEAADIALSLASDGSDIYLFHVLDPGTNSLVYRKCKPSGGGNGNICDNSADWGSEKTLVSGTDLSHPQAVVAKVPGDTIAIDSIYTMPTALDVVYERHYVDLADKTIVVAASGDDGFHRNCNESTGSDQDISSVNVRLGVIFSDIDCTDSLGSLNHAGFRFPNIVVPQGAIISSAYVDFRVSVKTGGAVGFTVYGEDADSPGSFLALTNCTEPCSGAIGNSSSRVRTMSNSVKSIDFTTNTYRIDVTKIIQEIVCRGASNSQPCVGDFNGSGTWASGNALALLLISSGISDNWVEIVAQEDTTGVLKPTLQINLATTGKKYSSGYSALPSGASSFSDFDHPLSSSEVSAVLSDDTNYASVSATTNFASQSAVPVFLFKVNNSNNSNAEAIDASAIVKSSVPTSSKNIFLQVYRGGSTNNWVTMGSDNTTAADTDIILDPAAISTNLSEYYFNETPGIGTLGAACTNATANCWSYWRIYQEAPGTNLNQVLSVDQFSLTFGSAVRSNSVSGGVKFRGGVKIK